MNQFCRVGAWAAVFLAAVAVVCSGWLSAQGNATFSITLTGDSIITQRLSPFEALPAFAAARKAVRDADAAFTNMEVIFPTSAAPPAAQSGGTWMASDPALLKELQWFGFNLFAAANNHSLDYGIQGLRDTRRVLEGGGAVYAGIGENLGEARAPAYLETARGRVALVACASTFAAGNQAGAQRADLRGRPGLNPLRFLTTYVVPRATLETLRQTKAALKMRLATGLGRAEPDTADRVTFLNATFRAAPDDQKAEPQVITDPHPGDLKGITDAVRDARRQADIVVVSIHAHEGIPGARELPAQFLVAFARATVDAGADVFVGHGPHLLRGLEIYKGKPIFYSLGNFIFQNETVRRLPADIYEQYGLAAEALPADLYDRRSARGTRGFPADPLYWESVVARVEFRAGRLAEIRLTPVTLGHGRPRAQRGRPELAAPADAGRILDRLAQLSSALGTRIEIHDGVGVIKP